MHQSVYDFVTQVCGRDEVEGKRVLEVGALDVNGSVRPYIVSLKPLTYVGTDMVPGRRVDLVVRAENLVDFFGADSFDLVICCEMLEHCRNWRRAVLNMLNVLRVGGLWVMTTRSAGFPRHDHPHDYWRWDWREWGWIQHLGTIHRLGNDLERPGMFLAWTRLATATMTDLREIHATPAPPARVNAGG